MAQAPLFYTSVVALSRDVHARKRVRTHPGMFGFAAGQHLLPAVIDEFAAACRHLPILFLPGGTYPTPVFLVGVRPGQNVLIDSDGRWQGSYIPAFVRRYPFILGEIEGASPVVCVDESSDLLNDTDGDLLFDGEGESAFLTEKIALVSGYFDAAKRTEAASNLLLHMELLAPITIDFRQGDVGATTIHGLLAVDERKLLDLSDEQVLRLHRESLLSPIYAHLLSLGAIELLGSRAQAKS